MQHTLLIIDDDPQTIAGLSPLLSGRDYAILTASSGADALALLDRQQRSGAPVQMVLAASHISSLNGAGLFSEIAERFPATSRVLLADSAEVHAAIESVNSGAAHRLLFKPVDAVLLARIIAETFEQHELLAKNRQLTEELEKANRELQKINAGLEDRVSEKADALVKAVYYDTLTGLASRTLIKDRLDQAIHLAARDKRKVAVFLIGMDRFKFINDSLGRQEGDRVLMQIADRFRRSVRIGDTVGRFGADVFCLLISEEERVETPGVIAQRLFEVISAPLNIKKHNVVMTASVGICIYPRDGDDAETLFANAETAMREAKKQANNSYRYYSGEFNQLAGKRLSLEAELRQAIAKREFMLLYQPRVNIDEECIVGAEALLRWRHPSRGLVSPGEFMPVLEETGLIQDVGKWVLEEACAALKRWQAQNISLQLAINLSPGQFRDRALPELFEKTAARVGVDLAKHNLEVEITESLVMEDVTITTDILKHLHEMGILIAIDDFGTGYSSLSYLIQFPLNYLKVDKSFVDNIHKSDDAKAIVEAIISLSYSLRLHVIAEGVETTMQLSALRALGCKQFQGYLFAKPMTEDELMTVIKHDKGASLVLQAPEDRLLMDGESSA